MWEFLTATGKYGFLFILVLAVMVFLLAMPGKEISIWGIKFHKQNIDMLGYVLKIFRLKRKLPKTIPDSWLNVLTLLYKNNDDVLSFDRFEHFVKQANSNVLDYYSVCNKMQEYGLVKVKYNYLQMTEKGLKLYHELIDQYEDGD